MGKKILIVSLAMIVFILVGGVSYFFGMKNNQPITETVFSRPGEKLESKSDVLTDKCPSNWEMYKNNTLAISFCYPKDKWGEVRLEPVESVTDLKKLMQNEHYYQEKSKNNNRYYNIFEIHFDKGDAKPTPVIRLMRNNAPVNECNDSNITSERIGCNKYMMELKNNQNICKYSNEYQKKGTLRQVRDGEGIKEIYNSCDNNVKTILSELTDYFDFQDYDTKEIIGWKYSYFLDLLSYKKLQNGYFDDALIYYNIDGISQIKHRINNWTGFFGFDHSYKNDKRVTLNENEFEKKRRNFETFVQSIETFIPSGEDLTKYKAGGDNMDDKSALVAKYYWLLTQKDFEGAYVLKKTSQSFEEFYKQYKDVHYVTPYDFQSLNDGRLTYFVQYQDYNKPVDRYQIKSTVINDKIDVEFIQKFTTEQVQNGNVTAYGVIRGNNSYVILKKNGTEIIVDSGHASFDFEGETGENVDMMDVKFFGDVRFSPSGKYLLYNQGGWEWCMGHVYDVEQEKEIMKLDSCQTFDFTDDEKYFYQCASSGMSAYRAGVVKSVPSFSDVFNVFGEAVSAEVYSKNNQYIDVECVYDRDLQEIIFELGKYDVNLPKKVLKYTLGE